jgi:hypothetical protein
MNDAAPLPSAIERLAVKAPAVVDAVGNDENAHGGLLSRATINAVDHLRMELLVMSTNENAVAEFAAIVDRLPPAALAQLLAEARAVEQHAQSAPSIETT